MRSTISDLGKAMSTLAEQSKSLATELDDFAAEVQKTQDAVRRLLNTLKSVVGSVVDKGVLGMVFELVTGDADDKIREVAADIKAVIDNHKRQADARKELLARLKEGIKSTSRELQVAARRELVEHLGSTVGNQLANLVDARTDLQLGISAMGPLNLAEGLLAFDPADPAGALESLNGMAEAALLFNPSTALPAIAMDPTGSWETLKGLTHAEDIITSDRPFLGVGALGFDVATAVIPGGAATKAGGLAKVGDDVAQAGRTGERVVGATPEIARSTQDLGEIRRSADGASERLEDLGGAPVGLPAVPGQQLPTTPLSDAHMPSPSMGPVPSADPTPEVTPAPRAEVPSPAPRDGATAPELSTDALPTHPDGSRGDGGAGSANRSESPNDEVFDPSGLGIEKRDEILS